jgi:hypothetical protein
MFTEIMPTPYRAEYPFKMAKKTQVKVVLSDEGKRKAEEAAKTARLRTLRLAKEAADRAAAKR